jgi:hypothetical protein
MNIRPEREMVEKAYMADSRRKAYEIAEEVGLVESLGYDKAVDYVRRVKKSMRIKGQLKAGAYAPDEERLADITTLFELREDMSAKLAYTMLLLNCYYRLRSEDDTVHMMAIDDTYEKNSALKRPFTMAEAIQICEAALTQYMNSIDEEKNEAARKKGYPGAGLNYTDERFIEKLEITESELQHMKSIKEDETEHEG